MQDFLKYIVSLIVDHPEDIKIEERSLGENISQYIIAANGEDMGKIIGKEGKIIQAIRNVAKILAIKENKQIRIEIAG
ncbi:KH domain-containing protein [Patescibacteria group bacterium]|nr:KH domain-containing protein [Patescibacteria group bacterium]MCL5797471.1 KH domain-containing protein [Patescibacteria group bacterium]